MAKTNIPERNTIVPRPNPEIDDALSTPQEVIDRRPTESIDDKQRILTPRQFPDMIGLGIAGCMRERVHHQHVEKEMDEWFRKLPQDKTERLKILEDTRTQMDTARLAMDLFYSRFRTLASTAKGA